LKLAPFLVAGLAACAKGEDPLNATSTATLPKPISEPTPTPEPTLEPTPTYPLEEITYQEAVTAPDAEILARAPKFKEDFDYAKEFGFDEGEVTKLTPSEAVRTGDGNKNIYTLYEDQAGETRMLWNLEAGVWEHVDKSKSVDPETNFVTRVFLISDNKPGTSMIDTYNAWNEFDEGLEYPVAEGFFKYALSQSYYYGNYREQFLASVKDRFSVLQSDLDSFNWDVWFIGSSLEERDAFMEEVALPAFRDDLNNLTPGESLKVPTILGKELEVDKNGLDLFVRCNYDTPLAEPQQKQDGVFRYWTNQMEFTGLELGENTELSYSYSTPDAWQMEIYKAVVGGWVFQDTLQSMVPCGVQFLNKITKDYQGPFPGLADGFIANILGEEKVEEYYKLLSSYGYSTPGKLGTFPDVILGNSNKFTDSILPELIIKVRQIEK